MLRPSLAVLCLAACGYQAPYELDVVALPQCADPTDVTQEATRTETTEIFPGVFETRLYQGDAVIAWGRAKRPASGQPSVIVRRVGQFTPVVDDTRACVTLTRSRSGHTATRLSDGRVFIAGGLSAGTSTATTEEYFPEVGRFSPAPDMGLSTVGLVLAKTRHTATPVADGRQVLLWGGEVSTTTGLLTPSSIRAVFDPEKGAYGLVPTPSSPTPRSRHLALTLPDGSLLVIGGKRSSDGQAATAIERLDPSAFSTRLATAALEALDPGAAFVASRQAVAVVADDRLTWLKPLGDGDVLLSSTVTLTQLHATPHLLVHDADVLVLGSGTSEVVRGDGGVEPGPDVSAATEGSCAVEFDPGRWLLIGATTQTLTWDGANVTAATFAPISPLRARHTCTLLDDGTVLVAGGTDPTGAELGDAIVFTPPLAH